MPAKKKESKKDVVQENKVFLTKEGLQKLIDELEDLKDNRRDEIAEKIKVALSLGDLSENAEYEDAKNEQAFIEGRIIELEALIKNAEIFKEKTGSKAKTANIGNKVELFNEDSKETEVYTIVGSIETDPLNNKISNESPVGAAIIGTAVGEVITVKTPAGSVKYTLKKIY